MKHEASLRRIVYYFGIATQKIKFCEEAAEYVSAMSRQMIDVNNIDHVVEEAADMIVVGMQLLIDQDFEFGYPTEVKLKESVKFAMMAVDDIFNRRETAEDNIKTAILMAYRLMKQWGRLDQLEEVVELKIKRTLDYIDSGHYDAKNN